MNGTARSTCFEECRESSYLFGMLIGRVTAVSWIQVSDGGRVKQPTSHCSLECSNMDALVVDCTWWDLEVLAFEILSNCVLPMLTALAAVDSRCQNLVLTFLQRRVRNIVNPFIKGIGERTSSHLQTEAKL